MSPGWFAQWPIVGVLLFLIGVIVFGAIAYNVQIKGPLLQWDVPVAKELHTEAVDTPSQFIEYFIFGFFAGKELLQVIVIILACVFPL